MANIDDMNMSGIQKLDDDMLDNIVGGVSAGDVVRIFFHDDSSSWYCPSCGQMIQCRLATVSFVERGVDGGTNAYWVKYSCCGYEARIRNDAII